MNPDDYFNNRWAYATKPKGNFCNFMQTPFYDIIAVPVTLTGLLSATGNNPLSIWSWIGLKDVTKALGLVQVIIGGAMLTVKYVLKKCGEPYPYWR